MSLALEGGFPTRLLETRDHGRIALHLARLSARCEQLLSPDETVVESLSRSMGDTLGTYDHAEFHALSGELIIAVMALRAEAHEKAPAGVSATAWLDGFRPMWREELPIALPGEGAKRLIDDLVAAPAGRIPNDGARVTRLLLEKGGIWIPSASVGLSGELDLAAAGFRPDQGRIRVRAVNVLASVLAGELGLIEPPAEDGQRWLCRARGGAAFTVPMNFDQDVETQLTSATLTKTIVWPGGGGHSR